MGPYRDSSMERNIARLDIAVGALEAQVEEFEKKANALEIDVGSRMSTLETAYKASWVLFVIVVLAVAVADAIAIHSIDEVAEKQQIEIEVLRKQIKEVEQSKLVCSTRPMTVGEAQTAIDFCREWGRP